MGQEPRADSPALRKMPPHAFNQAEGNIQRHDRTRKCSTKRMNQCESKIAVQEVKLPNSNAAMGLYRS
jgi:hypothetical protein